MYRTISWLFVSLVRFSVTLRSRRMTMMEFVTAKTSDSVWLMRMTANPLLAQLANQLQHLLLLDNAKVIGGFIDDH
jgi:hypothetical protein